MVAPNNNNIKEIEVSTPGIPPGKRSSRMGGIQSGLWQQLENRLVGE
jgi:hypothetical protein